MGIYDTYGERAGQLKVISTVSLRHYDVGDRVEIHDGVYITSVNVIVIHNSVFIAEFETLTSKWGGPIEPSGCLEHPWFGEVLEQVVAG